MNFIENKIRVFISSKCGDDEIEYNLIRKALKLRLDATNIFSTYLYEVDGPSTLRNNEEYLGELQRSDVALFLIDNETDVHEGVLNEFAVAVNQKIKSLFIFLNYDNKEPLKIETEVRNKTFFKYKTINSLEEFLTVGFEALVKDIIKVYKEHCTEKLDLEKIISETNNNYYGINSEYQTKSPGKSLNDNYEEKINPLEYNPIKDDDLIRIFTENMLASFSKTKNSFFELNYANRNELSDMFIKTSKDKDLEKNNCDLDLALTNLSKFLFNQESFNKSNFKTIKIFLENIISENELYIISNRLDAISLLYENKITESIELLEKTFTEAIELDIPIWLVTDLILDLSNIKRNSHAKGNIFFRSKFDDKIHKLENYINFPIIDRLYSRVYKEIIDSKIKIDYKTPYTFSTGTSIETILNDISDIFIIATITGSYTHTKLLINLIKSVFFEFYNYYKAPKWGLKALEFAIIDNDTKMIENIVNRKTNIISLIERKQFDNMFSNLSNMPIEYERAITKLHFLQYLGYYLSDKTYNTEIEIFLDYINNILSIPEDYYLLEPICRVLSNNYMRIDTSRLLYIINQILKLNSFRLVKEIEGLLSNIINMISIYPELDTIENTNAIHNIKQTIINLIDLTEEKDFDEHKNLTKEQIIDIFSIVIQIIYYSETSIDTIFHTSIEKLSLDLSEQIKHNGLYFDNDSNEIELRLENYISNLNYLVNKSSLSFGGPSPFQSIRALLIKTGHLLSDTQLFNVINSCIEILNNQNQYAINKKNSLQLLIFIKYYVKKNSIEFSFEYIKEHLSDIDLILSSNYLGYTNINLNIDYILFESVLFDDYNNNDLMESLMYITNYSDSELLNVYKTMNNYVKFSGNGKNKIFDTISNFIVKDLFHKDHEIVSEIIHLLFNMKDFIPYFNIYIKQLSNSPNHKIKLTLLNCITSLDLENEFIDIIEKFKFDNYYPFRYRCIKIIDITKNK